MLMREKYSAFVVLQKDEEFSLKGKGHYDNCYIVGPGGYVQRYLIPTTPEIVNQITQMELERVFHVSSLPRAISLRSSIIDDEKFVGPFGNRTVYVALIDSASDSY